MNLINGVSCKMIQANNGVLGRISILATSSVVDTPCPALVRCLFEQICGTHNRLQSVALIEKLWLLLHAFLVPYIGPALSPIMVCSSISISRFERLYWFPNRKKGLSCLNLT